MRARSIRFLLPIMVALCVSACMIEIKYQAPRWKCTLKCNGKTEKLECGYDSYPSMYEYSVPEFFVMDDGRVVFRFYDKESGFKLQAANDGPFKYGVKYNCSRSDDFFDVSFNWLYGGIAYGCDSGWICFKSSLMPGTSFTMDFEFDLSTSDGSRMEIRSGTFTLYDRIQPRNTAAGIQ